MVAVSAMDVRQPSSRRRRGQWTEQLQRGAVPIQKRILVRPHRRNVDIHATDVGMHALVRKIERWNRRIVVLIEARLQAVETRQRLQCVESKVWRHAERQRALPGRSLELRIPESR